MKLIIERQMVKLWGDVILHLNDSAETTFKRLEKKGIEIIKTGASYVIITKKGQVHSYTLEFERREPEAGLVKIERSYNGYSWHRPKSVVVWEKVWE